jgi:hypothetical protein
LRIIGCGLLVLALASQASAAGARCDGVSESSVAPPLQLARVAGNVSRVNFIANSGETPKTKSCPSASVDCRRAAFLLPGDNVLVDEIEGGFACATFVSTRGVETSGWLPASALEFRPALAATAPGDWAGEWRRVEATIKLKAAGNQLEADGEATWGSLDPQRVARGGVNMGEFSGSSRLRGNMLAFGEGYSGERAPDDKGGECHVRLRLFGPYILAEDNMRCGGMNVSFRGIYARAGKPMPTRSR